MKRIAVILAAGKGERMLPLTANTPKPLLLINNRPMVEYSICLLKRYGFEEIGINLYYLGEKIKRHLKDGSNFGVHINYVKENELTGTAGGVKAVIKALNIKDPFFVISSDMMVNFNLTEIFNFHLKRGGLATMCTYFREKEKLIASKSGLVKFNDKSKLVKQLVERPKDDDQLISQWVNSGIYVLDPKIIEFIPDEIDGSRIIDFPKHIFPKLIESNQLFAYPVDGGHYYQLGVDTPERIKMVEEDINKGIFKPVL